MCRTRTDGSEPERARPGELTGCLVKETLKAVSSLSGDGYILLRMKKPAPQQNRTPIISNTLREPETESERPRPVCCPPVDRWTHTHQKYHSLWMDRALTQQRVPQQSS